VVKSSLCDTLAGTSLLTGVGTKTYL